ncbi:MAG: hypothetical protein KatS3mg076_1577 [Candidatus Binatia bacterium]|nr:MAG: hypothetical protein KatS3mg076_1577 [Candidatus Binatia bacterium]
MFARRARRFGAFFFAALPSVAWGLSVTIDGVVVGDNGPRDLDPAPGVVSFDSEAPGGAGFSLPTGYAVAGRVALEPSGASGASLEAFAALGLDFLRAGRPPGAPGGTTTLSVEETFGPFPLSLEAFDGIEGRHVHDAPGALAPGNTLEFQAFVGGVAVEPPSGPLVSAPDPGFQAFPFSGGHGPLSVAGGSTFSARMELRFALGGTDDRLEVESAELVVGRRFRFDPRLSASLYRTSLVQAFEECDPTAATTLPDGTLACAGGELDGTPFSRGKLVLRSRVFPTGRPSVFWMLRSSSTQARRDTGVPPLGGKQLALRLVLRVTDETTQWTAVDQEVVCPTVTVPPTGNVVQKVSLANCLLADGSPPTPTFLANRAAKEVVSAAVVDASTGLPVAVPGVRGR